jgi:hypothetical protein
VSSIAVEPPALIDPKAKAHGFATAGSAFQPLPDDPLLMRGVVMSSHMAMMAAVVPSVVAHPVSARSCFSNPSIMISVAVFFLTCESCAG